MSVERRSRLLAALVGVAAFAVVGINAIAWMQAGAMTTYHDGSRRTARPESLSVVGKALVVARGVSIPRPRNERTPLDRGLPFDVVRFDTADGHTLEGWWIRPPPPAAANGSWYDDPARGAVHALVVAFHGYADSKESLLAVGHAFHVLGAEVLLVDFRGSGGSTGNATSVGWHEALDVAAAVAFATKERPDAPLVLYAQSMGCAAALRATHLGLVDPDAYVLDGPFDSLRNAVRARFRTMSRVPPEPLASILLFWGGRRWGIDPWAHAPARYARAVRANALVFRGADDPRVSGAAVRRVVDGLGARGRLVEIDGMTHEPAAAFDPVAFRAHVAAFLREAVRR